MARSKSPSDSSRAFLQSIMPAAVISRSRLTSAMFTEAIAFSLWDFVVDRVAPTIRHSPYGSYGQRCRTGAHSLTWWAALPFAEP